MQQIANDFQSSTFSTPTSQSVLAQAERKDTDMCEMCVCVCNIRKSEF